MLFRSVLECSREAVNRKLAKWMQTEDFKEWLNTEWLQQYNKLTSNEETEIEAFKQLTRYMIAQFTKKLDVKADITEKVEGTVNVVNTIQLLKEYEAAFQETTTQTTNIPQNNTPKQLDQPETTS